MADTVDENIVVDVACRGVSTQRALDEPLLADGRSGRGSAAAAVGGWKCAKRVLLRLRSSGVIAARAWESSGELGNRWVAATATTAAAPANYQSD